MGKKNSEAAAHRSSIALLQERFRQLERIKELREEREQIQAVTDAGRRSPSTCYEQQQPAASNWFIHPDLIHPSRPLSGSPPSSLRSRDEQPLSYSEGDVDTSLHL